MVLSNDMKKAIAFGLIIGAIISICNLCFASERESLTPSVINGRFFAQYNGGVIAASSTNNLYYIELEPGYIYYAENTSSLKALGLSNSLDIGTKVDIVMLNTNETYSVQGSAKYLYLSESGGSSYVNFSREKLNGMSDFVDNIAYYLSVNDLSSVWVLVVPIIAISVLFGLGFYLLKRLLNRIKRAKGGV